MGALCSGPFTFTASKDRFLKVVRHYLLPIGETAEVILKDLSEKIEFLQTIMKVEKLSMPYQGSTIGS